MGPPPLPLGQRVTVAHGSASALDHTRMAIVVVHLVAVLVRSNDGHFVQVRNHRCVSKRVLRVDARVPVLEHNQVQRLVEPPVVVPAREAPWMDM